MPAIDSMETLTHEIVKAHRSRIEDAGHLKATVGSMLEDLHRTHRSTSISLNSTLRKFRTARRTEVQGTLKGYESTRKALSKRLHFGLAQAKSTCEANVRAMLIGMRRAHRDTSVTLRHSLAQTAADRRASVNGTLHHCGQDRHSAGQSLHEGLAHGNIDRKASVQGLLAGMGRSRRSISSGLRASLAHDSAVLKSSTAAALREFGRQQAVLRTELAGVHGQWQEMVALVNATRRGFTSSITASTKPPTTPNGHAAAPTAKGAVEETPELNTLRARVFEFLADHPDGSRLVEMEGELKASRFQMSRVLRNLMDENKVEKRNLLYFAI